MEDYDTSAVTSVSALSTIITEAVSAQILHSLRLVVEGEAVRLVRIAFCLYARNEINALQ